MNTQKRHKGYIAHSPASMCYEITGDGPKDRGFFHLDRKIDEEERKKFLERSSLFHLGKTKDGKVLFPSILSVANFFTLKSDRRLFAEVPLQIRFADNTTIEGKLIRGKLDPSSSSAFGQLSAFDLKVFVAVLKLWEKQDYRVMEEKSKGKPMMVGVVKCSKYEIAKTVFPKLISPGKRDMQLIQDSLMKLQGRPCCIVMPDKDRQYSLGLQLLAGVTWAKLTAKEGKEQSSVNIILSEVITDQFRLKRFLVRSIENLTALKGELPRLLYLYLEPRLLSLEPGTVYSKNLSDLIKELALPFANWHKFPSQRQKIFKGAIEELNGKPSSKDGFVFELKIEKGSYDFKLIAVLKRMPAVVTNDNKEPLPNEADSTIKALG